MTPGNSEGGSTEEPHEAARWGTGQATWKIKWPKCTDAASALTALESRDGLKHFGPVEHVSLFSLCHMDTNDRKDAPSCADAPSQHSLVSCC